MATNKKIRSRDEIEQKYKWNLRAMYPDEAEWEKDYKDAEEMAESFTFSGHLETAPRLCWMHLPQGMLCGRK